MAVYIGCDVGTIGVKAAIVTDEPTHLRESPEWLVELPHTSPFLAGWHVFLTRYERMKGNPFRAALRLIDEIRLAFPSAEALPLCLTGGGGKRLSERLGVPHENEFRALSRGVALLYPEVTQIFEIGGESARFLRVAVDLRTGDVGIVDYEVNSECAAGTGSFLDQQAARLRYRVEDVGDVALSSDRSAKIAGRCSVFAKSDMVHAQQKGATPAEVLRGLCEAVARNFKASVAKGKETRERTAFVGGVAANRGVFLAVAEVFGLDGALIAPAHPGFYGAIGAALLLRNRENRGAASARLPVSGREERVVTSFWPPLSLNRVRLLRNEAKPYCFSDREPVIDVYLGIDVGSVSTNFVCIDRNGDMIHEIYLRTEGRPIEVVGRGLREIDALMGDRIAVRGTGTTGSGRELIGELVGADTVNDEITAHKTGACEVARRYLGADVDTIFEIGGQDSKYIHLRDGVVVDFAMNEACAAGTGSFLEEQAEKLGVDIAGQFSHLALGSGSPARLGERCTVFIERDVSRCHQQGASREDLVAGLAYAVVHNYLNRVVRGRPVGRVVFFQGGTAYNDAVAAAFAQVLGQPVIVPPHCGVVGAYGAALLAREKAHSLGLRTTFRGFRLEDVDRKVRAFTCEGCSNRCDVQEFIIEGAKSYWGDKCSERYRKPVKGHREPVLPDLLALREAALRKDYFAGFLEGKDGEKAETDAQRAARWAARRQLGTAGVPCAMYSYEQLPFWGTYLRALGFDLELSGSTTKDVADLGAEAAVAEPCHPVQVAHGHVVFLLRKGADVVLLPNAISAETRGQGTSYMCPWGQTLPFVVAASPLVRAAKHRILAPTVRFREGPEVVEAALWRACKPFGVARAHHRVAVTLAYRAQSAFRAWLAREGRRALETIQRAQQPAVVLVGRPYNLYDKGINLNIPRKLRTMYGLDTLPLDFLPLDGVSLADVHANMYWSYGRKILQTARLASRNPLLHLLYLTNFKCGPDSYVRQFCEDAAVKPHLTLQFDGHGNDAGFMTRCEAYLDSKGILRWWTSGPC